MSAFGDRAGGLRLIRIILACVAVGVIVNSLGSYYLWRQTNAQAQQVSNERFRNTSAGCVLASGQNYAILEFLRKRHADKGTLTDARPLFPVLSAGQCDLLAHRQVDTR